MCVPHLKLTIILIRYSVRTCWNRRAFSLHMLTLSLSCWWTPPPTGDGLALPHVHMFVHDHPRKSCQPLASILSANLFQIFTQESTELDWRHFLKVRTTCLMSHHCSYIDQARQFEGGRVVLVGYQKASRGKNVPTKSQAVTPPLKKSISLSAGANAATQQVLSETKVFTCLDLFAHQLLSPHIPEQQGDQLWRVFHRHR